MIKIYYNDAVHRRRCQERMRPAPTFDRLRCDGCGVTILREWPHKQYGQVVFVLDMFLVREWP